MCVHARNPRGARAFCHEHGEERLTSLSACVLALEYSSTSVRAFCVESDPTQPRAHGSASRACSTAGLSLRLDVAVGRCSAAVIPCLASRALSSARLIVPRFPVRCVCELGKMVSHDNRLPIGIVSGPLTGSAVFQSPCETQVSSLIGSALAIL